MTQLFPAFEHDPRFPLQHFTILPALIREPDEATFLEAEKPQPFPRVKD